MQPRLGDLLAAVAAHAVGALVDTREGFFDRLEDFGVGLFQLQLYMDFVVPAGLIGHVALAGVVFHRRLERLDAAGPEYFRALFEQRGLEDLHVHRNWTLLRGHPGRLNSKY